MKYLQPVFEKNNVAIVLASSAYYAPYMAITIQSIIENRSEDHNYDINILNREIKTEDREKISRLVNSSRNISIRYIDVDQELADLNYNYREGYAPESFYRVLLPYLLPNYSKVLYLDSDVVAVEDIAHLYETDVTGYLTAAVRDPDGIKCYFQNYYDRQLYMDQVLQLKDPTDYFQSGVMLINLEEFRNQYKLDELTSAACNPEIVWGDQDVLNLLCKGKVKHLDAAWNTIVDGYKGRVRDVREWAPDWIYESYIAARKAPKIVHFAGVQPWKDPEVDMNEYFWPVAEKSPYYSVIKERIEENRSIPSKKERNKGGYRYAISVIVPVYNTEEYLEETLESVVNQTIGFEKYIQLILVNNATPDSSGEICKEYLSRYPDNVVYVELEHNMGPDGARNEGLKYVQGKYVNFLDSDDKWSLNAFEKAFDYFEPRYYEIDVLACRVKRFDAQNNWELHDYKFYRTRLIDITIEYKCIQQNLCSCFIKASILKMHRLPENIKHAEDAIFLYGIIKKKNLYGALKEAVFYYRKRRTKTSAVQIRAEDRSLYIDTVQNGYLDMLDLGGDKKILPYLQMLMVDELYDRLNAEKTTVLTDDEWDEYVRLLKSIIVKLDDDIIWGFTRLSREYRFYLLSIKYNDIWDRIVMREDAVTLNNIILYRLRERINLTVEVTEVCGDYLRLRGRIRLMLPQGQFSILAISQNGHEFSVELSNNVISEEIKLALGEEVYRFNYFDVRLPLNMVSEVSFSLLFKGNKYRMGMSLGKFSKLTREFSNQYYLRKGYCITIKDDKIRAVPCGRKLMLQREKRLQKELIKKKKYKMAILRVLIIAYRMTHHNLKKWLITDRIMQANDSGESFFRYLSTIDHEGIRPYFVIDERSPDYKRMRAYGRVVKYGSWRHKFLFLTADKLISSLSNDWVFDLMPYNRNYLGALCTAEFVHLQHGIIKDDISSDLFVFKRKFDLFVTSGKAEYDSVVNGAYGYDENVVKLTGLPRLDMLNTGSKKDKFRLVIAPTWRKGLTSGYNRSIDQFRCDESLYETDFYQFYNGLINDERLLSCMKKANISGELRLHPVLENAKDLFIGNSIFSITSGQGDYISGINDTCLVVTDYSSIAFEYAYTYTPVIYTQFDKDEFEKTHTYKPGYFDYERDGFGPVCYDYESTVNAIISAIENGCVMEKKYHKRAEDFFAFRDGKNCERIYQEILKLDREA